MERVETLSEKLREQLAQKATPDQLLMTVQMLQSELMHIKSTSNGVKQNTPAIDIPFSINEPVQEETVKLPEEKTVEVLQIDEAEVEAELEEIKRNLESREKIHTQNKPRLLFDPVEDTPTLTHQKQSHTPAKSVREVHETIQSESSSLNDKLKQQKSELSDTLKDLAIKDLRKAIGVNDRFLFINELFRGDEVMYERSIKTINGFTIFPEAEYWIKRELKLKLAWDESNHVVKQFDQLIKRRFSAI